MGARSNKLAEIAAVEKRKDALQKRIDALEMIKAQLDNLKGLIDSLQNHHDETKRIDLDALSIDDQIWKRIDYDSCLDNYQGIIGKIDSAISIINEKLSELRAEMVLIDQELDRLYQELEGLTDDDDEVEY